MKLPLIYRILAPTLAVSTLLLAVGLTAGIYAYNWNERVSRLLDNRVGAVLTTQEMVLAVRDIRHMLTRYQLTKDAAYLDLAKTSVEEAQQFASRLQESPLEEDDKDLQETSQALDEVERRINQFDTPAETDTDSIRQLITGETLAKSQALLDRRQEAVSLESRQNRLNADRIGRSLAILGFCGAGAGLLAGFGVARGISRSIQQLGGSVHSMAETVFQDSNTHLSRPEGINDLLTTIGSIRQKTVGIMDELEQSREKATRSDQLAAVGQLAAGIAHELRNPLTAVKPLVDAAVELNAPLRGPELLVLQDEVAHMEQMTQAFLDFARPPELARQPVQVNQVVEQCMELVRRKCEMLGIDVSLDAKTEVQVVGDSQQLRQVILNLLLNAIDAQPNGGSINVKIAEAPESGDCMIEIVDEGSGIPQESLDRIFDPFVSTKETGMGLGLAISRRIVRSHGGDITAFDSPGGGAVFRVQLPVSEIPEGVASV